MHDVIINKYIDLYKQDKNRYIKIRNNLGIILNRKHEVGVSNYIKCKWLFKIKLKAKCDQT